MIFYVYGCLPVYMFVRDALAGQKRALDALELELEML